MHLISLKYLSYQISQWTDRRAVTPANIVHENLSEKYLKKNCILFIRRSSVSKHLLSEIYSWNSCHRLSLGCDLPVILYNLCWVSGGLLSINFRKSSLLIRLKSDHCLLLSTHAHFTNMTPPPSFFSGGSAQLTWLVIGAPHFPHVVDTILWPNFFTGGSAQITWLVIGAPHCPHVVDTTPWPNIIFGGSAQKYDWE